MGAAAIWAAVAGFGRRLASTSLGRAVIALLGLLVAFLMVFHVGHARGVRAEKDKRRQIAARAAAKKERLKHEVSDLGRDELVDRATRWVRD